MVVCGVQPGVPDVRGVGRVHHNGVLPAAGRPRSVHGRGQETVTGHAAVDGRR